MASDAEPAWRQLEPASVLVNLIPTLWRTVRSLWYVIIPVAVGGSIQGVVDLGFLLVFLVLAVVRTVLHYVSLRYRMVGGKLEILTGILGRQHRVIDPARIQNLEIVQNFFHRMAGLVELRVETAGDVGAEGLLSAISVKEAEALRAELEAARRGTAVGAPTERDPEPEVVGVVTFAEIVGFGLSAGRVTATVLTIGVVLQTIGQFSTELQERAIASRDPTTMLALLLVAFAFAYGSATTSAVLRFAGFKLLRGARGIATESGLFTRRRLEIPPKKIQVLRVDEPPVRRLLGYATVHIETAASAVPGQERGAADAMIPMVPHEGVGETLGLVLPGMPAHLWSEPLLPAAPRVLLRALIGATIRWGAVAGGLVAFGWGWWPLVLLGWGWAVAWLDWRAQGWRLEGDWLVTRRGFTSRRTWLLSLDKVQSLHRTQGPLMRRHGLARLEIWIAGSRVTLPDLREADVDELFATISARWSRAAA